MIIVHDVEKSILLFHREKISGSHLYSSSIESDTSEVTAEILLFFNCSSSGLIWYVLA